MLRTFLSFLLVIADVTTIGGLAKSEVEEFKRNKVEKAKEPASKYVYKQQSHSPTTMEEQFESDMAPATNVVNEIAKNLSIICSCHCRCGKGNILWQQTMDQIQRVSRNMNFMQNINHIVKPLLCFQMSLHWKSGKQNHSKNPS